MQARDDPVDHLVEKFGGRAEGESHVVGASGAELRSVATGDAGKPAEPPGGVLPGFVGRHVQPGDERRLGEEHGDLRQFGREAFVEVVAVTVQEGQQPVGPRRAGVPGGDGRLAAHPVRATPQLDWNRRETSMEPLVAAVPVLPSINLELAQGMIMSEEKDKSKPQSKPRNGLIVGIVIGAGLGMVFGRVLFGESGTGYVYGSIIGAAAGFVFSLLTASRQSVTP